MKVQHGTWMVWWMMCCTVGWPGPALAPVAGRRTVLELDITAAAAAPTGHKTDWLRETRCYKWAVNGLPFQGQANIKPGILLFFTLRIPRGKWDVKVWGGTAGVPICSAGALPLMIWMLAGIRWCKLLEWPWNTMKAAQVFSDQQERGNNIHRQPTYSALTCWPLIVATGIDGVVAILLSMVTVIWPGTLGGMGIWPWLEAGAGAIRRLGIGDFRTA